MKDQKWKPYVEPENRPAPSPVPVLEQAHLKVFAEREKEYGPPSASFEITAQYWTTYLKSRGLIAPDVRLQFFDVCRMMELLKITRLGFDPLAVDSSVDVCGYEAVVDRIIREQ